LEERKNIQNIRFQIEQKFYDELQAKKKGEQRKVEERKKERVFLERVENACFVHDILDSRFCDEVKTVGPKGCLTLDNGTELCASVPYGLAHEEI
jgi:hypothetical protein